MGRCGKGIERYCPKETRTSISSPGGLPVGPDDSLIPPRLKIVSWESHLDTDRRRQVAGSYLLAERKDLGLGRVLATSIHQMLRLWTIRLPPSSRFSIPKVIN